MASVGMIHEVFSNAVQNLKDQAQKIGSSLKQQGQRVWQTLSNDGTNNVTDIEKVGDAVKRTVVDETHVSIYKDSEDPGTIGDVIANKIQGDYLAVMERAFRARQSSSIRCIAHAAAVRAGHGNPAGVFTGGVQQYVQNMLKAGQK